MFWKILPILWRNVSAINLYNPDKIKPRRNEVSWFHQNTPPFPSLHTHPFLTEEGGDTLPAGEGVWWAHFSDIVARILKDRLTAAAEEL